MDGVNGTQPSTSTSLLRGVNVRLELLGLPIVRAVDDPAEQLVAPILLRQRELSRRLADRLPPVDERIEGFLTAYLQGMDAEAPMPRAEPLMV